ncbi:hypothetical protein BWD09_10330 [Neisseria dentiae]|uniref:DUF4189 domain-containing protein n=2 Tax=Neisseria dentiae TaxID=194197 RepID=A0A1X3D3N3_9NEIS|nr:hypothetical protein BWD09_10330 [Neisseria dentiae]
MKRVVWIFVWLVCTQVNAGELNAANNPAMNPCIQRPELSGCGANGNGQAITNIINIPSHYGAIALDGSKMILGSSENNLKSLRAAKKEAVQDCINLGGTKTSCKVISFTRNGCIALALGGKGAGTQSFSSSRATAQEAESAALQGCRRDGGQKCYIAYSKCSRDPRYQVDRAVME